MLLGIVTDVHEEVEILRWALDQFQQRQVDQVVTVGDTCDLFTANSRGDETAELLRAVNAIGVWGNHDIGLCYEVTDGVRQRARASSLAFMQTMQPFLVIDDCRFSHVEPWLDATRTEELWYVEGPPDTAAKAARSFSAVPESTLFIGHFHHWLIITPDGRLDWNGEQPIRLPTNTRHLIVVGPVINGWCATFNTTTRDLTPIRMPGMGGEDFT